MVETHHGSLAAQSESTSLSDQQIRRALARTLKSPEFHSAPQLCAFLRFVGTATLKHGRDSLKGYTIAVEALGRPEEFNPVTDPIVRVEAARLRRRLEKYYAGSGSEDPVRIVIPKGSYAPEFRPAECPERQKSFSVPQESAPALSISHPPSGEPGRKEAVQARRYSLAFVAAAMAASGTVFLLIGYLAGSMQ
ncbi:hypothetical protein [Labrenzia sp. OB1]|uniref:hypothetical protein n=1 Tax=Labrenzia sp. OB1 TaxID=1561204 RepID=UPI0012E91581|nr:hypothetical protein [Labrenzia sp. OB1]